MRRPAEGLQLRLLGGFRADRGGKPVADSTWERLTARALVKLLAVEPSHRLHREQVMETPWPDAAPEAASHGLLSVLPG